jgi:hypothetical protein
MKKLKRALKEARVKFSDEIIEQYLTREGRVIANYCIFISPSQLSGGASIHQVSQGEEWFTLGMSDDFHLACVDFLKRQGVPVFKEPSELEKYLEELKARNQ